MTNKVILASIILLFSPSSLSTELVYETDFSQLPDNWFFLNNWSFGPEGAHFYLYTSGNFDATLATGDSWPPTPTIFIPDGADSAQVSIEHFLNVSGGESCNMQFRIYLGSTGHSGVMVWEEELYSGGIYQNYYSVFSPEWLEGGEHLSIMFRIDGAGDDFGSRIEWEIHDLKVTVFGEGLALPQRSWGGIKGSFQ